MITVAAESPYSADAQALMEALSTRLADITGDGGQSSFDPEDVIAPRALFAVGRDVGGVALGCGAFRPLQADVAEIKRMFASPGTVGVGTLVLAFLEAQARHLGYRAVWLETRLVNTRAVDFYLRRGYRVIPNFGKYVGNTAAVCLGKELLS